MPVNSFEDYPLTWKPSKALLKFPMYISLSELLEQDILSGRLPPKTKLPPQRELADFLDVNLSTITRAFKLCETKGLIYAAVGSGTYVSSMALSVSARTFLCTEIVSFCFSMIKSCFSK